VGQIKLCSPDHIALLVHRTFNVSIPRHHIPTDHWEFEYGATENDPEFNAEATAAARDREETGPDSAGAQQEMVGGGRWVHSLSGATLGGPDGFLEFTVIGFTIANEMLSLRGSIQLDPFSPAHVLQTSMKTSEEPSETSTAAVRDAVFPPEEEEEEEGSDVDTFEQLGRMSDNAVAMEAKRRAEEAKEYETRKKQKRKRKDREEDEKVKMKSKSNGDQHA